MLENLPKKIAEYFHQKTLLESKPPEKKVSRRKFLRYLFLGTGAAFLSSSVAPSAQQESKEILKPGSTLLLDFFTDLEKELDRLTVQAFGNSSSFSNTSKKLNITDAKDVNDIKKVLPTTKEEAAVLMLKMLQIHYGNHGRSVETVLKTAGARFGGQTDHINVEMSQAISSMEIAETELGYRLVLHISPQIAQKLIEDSGADLVSMSMIVGDFTADLITRKEVLKHPNMPLLQPKPRITINNKEEPVRYSIEETIVGEVIKRDLTPEEALEYEKKSAELVVVDGKPEDIRFIELGDYKDPNTAYTNLKALNQIVKNTGKIVVAAAGNPHEGKTPDIRSAKRRLREEGGLEPGLIMVGVDDSVYGQIRDVCAYGADFYIKAEDIHSLGVKNAGSSYATPIVEQMVSFLFSQGITDINKIRAELKLSSKMVLIPSGNKPLEFSLSQTLVNILEEALQEQNLFDSDNVKSNLEKMSSMSDEELLVVYDAGQDDLDQTMGAILKLVKEKKNLFAPDENILAIDLKKLFLEAIPLISDETYIINIEEFMRRWNIPSPQQLLKQ